VNRPLLGFDYGSDDSEEEEDADETEANKGQTIDYCTFLIIREISFSCILFSFTCGLLWSEYHKNGQ
jgi:hypothetical protein